MNWLKICGDFNTIYFKGKTAATIQRKEWLGFLVEIAPELRYIQEQKAGELPKMGYKFCDYLVESLREVKIHFVSDYELGKSESNLDDINVGCIYSTIDGIR